MRFTAVQMVGTQRSGSNLLRLMLNQLKEVAAPHPPHILERFMPLLPVYGNLHMAENFRLLVHDVCSLVAYNPVQWQHISLKQNEIIARCHIPSLPEIFRVIYEMNAENEGANIWLCKSLFNIHYTNLLEATIQPLYIFLYRDGRDVACSFKKTCVGEKHVYHIAKKWQYEQALCTTLRQAAGCNRVLGVQYEKLITKPEIVLKEICSFIGATYSNTCLEFHTSAEAKNTASSGKMWQNVERSIIANNFNNYRTALSPTEIFLFESVAGKALKQLGYATDFIWDKETIFDADEIKIFDRQNELLKQSTRQQQPVEEVEKRRMQDALLHSIRKRMAHTHSCNLEKIAI